MTPRRSRRRHTLLLGAGLLLLLAAAAGIALAVHPAATSGALDPGVPNEQTLIDRGLSGVPGPGQPSAPITVDRVVTDGATTYVQFHSTVSLGRVSEVIPELYDDTGAFMGLGSGGSYTSGALGWTRFVPALPSWFPWHPPTGPLHGVFSLGPLPLTARAAVLQFAGLRFTKLETVHVPLNLSALRRRSAYSGPLVQRAGLHLRVAAARDTSLVLGFSPFGDTRGATLTDAQGHVVPLRTMSSGCSISSLANVAPLVCRQVWTYPSQRQGARLTLTIRSFVADRSGAVANAVGAGPWRLSVVIP